MTEMASDLQPVFLQAMVVNIYVGHVLRIHIPLAKNEFRRVPSFNPNYYVEAIYAYKNKNAGKYVYKFRGVEIIAGDKHGS